MVVHYSEHKLSISKILFDKKVFNVEDLISINIPTAIVGDFKVENKSDLLNILEDIFSLFDISQTGNASFRILILYNKKF